MFRSTHLGEATQLKLARPRNALKFELYSDGVDENEPVVLAAQLPLVTVDHVNRLQSAVASLDRTDTSTVLDKAGSLVHVETFDDASINVIRDGFTLAGFEPDDLDNRACLICCDDKHDSVDGDALVYMGSQYVHTECLDEFVTCLDEVWNYTDVILPERL